MTFGELDLEAEKLKQAITQKAGGKGLRLLHLPIERDTALVTALLAGIKGGWAVRWHQDSRSFHEISPGLHEDEAVCVHASEVQGLNIGEAKYIAMDDPAIISSTEPLAAGSDADIPSFSMIFPGGMHMAEDAIIEALEQLSGHLSPRESDCMLLVQESSPATFLLHLLWCLYTGTNMRLHKGDLPAIGPASGMDLSVFFCGGYPKELHFSEKYRLVTDAVKFADQNGFKAVWTPERHFNEFGGLFPNPSVLGAALAAITQKVQIRSGSVVSTLHHSVRLAEDWAVVDNLSGGRVALSFASGWQQNDFVFFPERYHDRHAVMLDQVSQVQRLWRGETMSFPGVDGQDVQLKIFPEPMQSELPVWITCSGSEKTFYDAGSRGVHLLTHMFWQGEDELAQKIKIYRDALASHGYDPRSRKVAVMLHTCLGPDKQQVHKQVETPMKDYLRSSIHLLEAMLSKPKNASEGPVSVGKYKMNWEKVPRHIMEELLDMAFERFVERASLLGDLGHARRMVRELKEVGVDEIACLIDFGLPTDEVMRGLTHLAELNRECNGPVTRGGSVTLVEALPEMYAHPGWQATLQGARHCLAERNRFADPTVLPSNTLLEEYDFIDQPAGKTSVTIDMRRSGSGFYAGLEHAGDLLSDDF